MALFRIADKKLTEIKEMSFKLEKDLQSITESNLESLFGLDFVRSEFEREGLRVDTLAFDRAAKSFVIIEYKRDQSFSVVDQGVAYLSLMLNNKEVFLVEYNEKKNQTLKRSDIDWTQSRVIFLAKSFTNHQRAAVGFQDFPIELWQVTRYDGGLLHYEKIQTKKPSATMKAVRPGKDTEDIVKQVRTYTEEDLVPAQGKIRDLYVELKSRILKLDEQLHIHPTKTYIAFRHGDNWQNIVIINFRSDRLRVQLNRTKPENLKDPERKIVYDKDSFKIFNQHMSHLDVKTDSELEYAVYIAQQAIERFRSNIEK